MDIVNYSLDEKIPPAHTSSSDEVASPSPAASTSSFHTAQIFPKSTAEYPDRKRLINLSTENYLFGEKIPPSAAHPGRTARPLSFLPFASLFQFPP